MHTCILHLQNPSCLPAVASAKERACRRAKSDGESLCSPSWQYFWGRPQNHIIVTKRI